MRGRQVEAGVATHRRDGSACHLSHRPTRIADQGLVVRAEEHAPFGQARVTSRLTAPVRDVPLGHRVPCIAPDPVKSVFAVGDELAGRLVERGECFADVTEPLTRQAPGMRHLRHSQGPRRRDEGHDERPTPEVRFDAQQAGGQGVCHDLPSGESVLLSAASACRARAWGVCPRTSGPTPDIRRGALGRRLHRRAAQRVLSRSRRRAATIFVQPVP